MPCVLYAVCLTPLIFLLIVVILHWIHYSSSILLLGAEFTAAFSTFIRVKPEAGAVRVEERIVPYV
ncbi:MAG: hypothetical protein SFV81_28940 [Pirellulaceae bacterium]|nr:hypothetical protein [Pirellulaceae bacterium]